MPASKEQIADVFERHVGRFGYSKATVEDVAAELGISKKTIYEHFSSKQDLYLYVVERIAATWRGELRAALTGLPTATERLRVLLLNVFKGARSHIDETTRAEWQQEYAIVGEALVKAVGEVVHEVLASGEPGEFALSDPVLAERLLGAMSLEYTMALREDPKLQTDEQVVEGLLRFLGAA